MDRCTNLITDDDDGVSSSSIIDSYPKDDPDDEQDDKRKDVDRLARQRLGEIIATPEADRSPEYTQIKELLGIISTPA